MAQKLDVQVHILELTTQEQATSLLEVAQPLTAIGVPEAVFDRDDFIDKFIVYKQAYKLIKTVASYAHNGILPAILAEGSILGFYTLPDMMDQGGFIKLAKWLKTRAGQDAVRRLQRRAKLERKAKGVLTPRQVQMNEIFAMMRREFARERKQTIESYDAKLRAIRKKYRKKQRSMERAVSRIDERFEPISRYEEPSEDEVAAKAYELYEADVALKEKPAKSKLHAGVEYAMQHFGQRARELFQIDFAGSEENLSSMEEFYKTKILGFRTEADKGNKSKTIHPSLGK